MPTTQAADSGHDGEPRPPVSGPLFTLTVAGVGVTLPWEVATVSVIILVILVITTRVRPGTATFQ